MNKEDIKVLRFKDDLVKLLNKYDYDITGTSLDNGDICIENGKGENYIMQDTKDIMKEVFVEDKQYDYEYKNVMEEYILESFKNSKPRDMCIGNFIGVGTGIVTSDKYKAEKILDDIAEKETNNVVRYIKSKNELKLILNNKASYTDYTWINPEVKARGYRLQNAWIDKNIGLELFDEVIKPTCNYCGKDNIKVI